MCPPLSGRLKFKASSVQFETWWKAAPDGTTPGLSEMFQRRC